MIRARELIKDQMKEVRQELSDKVHLVRRLQALNKTNKDLLTISIDARRQIDSIGNIKLANDMNLVVDEASSNYRTFKRRINGINKEISELKSTYSDLSRIVARIDNETI